MNAVADKAERKGPKWVQPVSDYLPILVFLATYKLTDDDIITATVVLVAVTLVTLVMSWVLSRSLPVIALFAAGVLTVFGGLTYAFDDPIFIKIKPTVMQILFAVGLYVSQALGKPVLRRLLRMAFELPDQAWKVLTYRFCIFFLIMAGANEVVWRNFSEEFWVLFDTIIQMVITFGFMMSQLPYMMKHSTDGESDKKGA